MAGYRLLQKEVDDLNDELYQLKLKQPEILKLRNEALEQGDLRENSAYDTAKAALRENLHEIERIENILGNHEIVDELSIRTDIIDIGTRFTLTDLDTNEKFEFTFVTNGQGSVLKKTISQMSDIGNKVFNKSQGEKISAKTSNGENKTFEITQILGKG